MSFEDEVLRYWRQDYDTQSIANLLQAEEHDVYGVIAHRKRAAKITLDTQAYRAAPTKVALPYAGYDPTEVQWS